MSGDAVQTATPAEVAVEATPVAVVESTPAAETAPAAATAETEAPAAAAAAAQPESQVTMDYTTVNQLLELRSTFTALPAAFENFPMKIRRDTPIVQRDTSGPAPLRRSQPRKPSGPGQPSVLGTRQRNDPIRPFRNLLNKLAPDNFEILFLEFENSILPLIQNAIVLNQVVEVMAEKIRDEPLYSDLYATFCVRLHKIETMIYGPPRDDLIKFISSPDFTPDLTEKRPFGVIFRTLLLNFCRQSFYQISDSPKEQLTDEDRAKMTSIEIDEFELAYFREKRHNAGLIMFIGSAFVHRLLHSGILKECILYLTRAYDNSVPADERDIDCLLNLLKIIGPAVQEMSDISKKEPDNTYQQLLNVTSERVRRLSQIPGLPNRPRFILMDILDMISSQFVNVVRVGPRRSDEPARETPAAGTSGDGRSRRGGASGPGGSEENRRAPKSSLRIGGSQKIVPISSDFFSDLSRSSRSSRSSASTAAAAQSATTTRAALSNDNAFALLQADSASTAAPAASAAPAKPAVEYPAASQVSQALASFKSSYSPEDVEDVIALFKEADPTEEAAIAAAFAFISWYLDLPSSFYSKAEEVMQVVFAGLPAGAIVAAFGRLCEDIEDILVDCPRAFEIAASLLVKLAKFVDGGMDAVNAMLPAASTKVDITTINDGALVKAIAGEVAKAN
ncbi:hypothetical protein H696_03941 [Fonticula alba]|uniref:MIF4G domain-containing protein n=1 Tax=Fonticula alba TaxID=691883 RepID=A0A058Z5K5_FONAL|nr:hypothetical protein H696_03941 [Fonticula alba]KCV69520.1 hypothetical protein H696_03941 [Fonticula alba]|eukprot:XP_009496085.1 hypothetical protein H696_03941 [Fonticula alba]